MIVGPLVATKRFREAIQFAYQQLRAFSSDAVAHRDYITLVSQYGSKANLNPPDRVDADSAVLIENSKSGNQRWVVLEDDTADLTCLSGRRAKTMSFVVFDGSRPYRVR